MNILFLGYTDSPLVDFIRDGGDEVTALAADINPLVSRMVALATFPSAPPDFLISYGYRHILRKPVLDLFPRRAINLHISYLPWNRGADPNLWSWIDGTPKGVTIHHLDEGIDTGDIIAQRRIDMEPAETLASSYARLRAELDDLFRATWPAIRAGTAPRIPQPRAPHRMRDRIRIEHMLTRGWETPVTTLVSTGAR